MEEVAWGQHFFGFDTPGVFKSINKQNELTIHNINGLHGHSEFFRIIFGLGGLLGICLNGYIKAQKIAVPRILLSYFLIITIVAGLDLYNDYFPIEKGFDRGVRWMSEIIEALIGIAGLFYVWLMDRKLKYQR